MLRLSPYKLPRFIWLSVAGHVLLTWLAFVISPLLPPATRLATVKRPDTLQVRIAEPVVRKPAIGQVAIGQERPRQKPAAQPPKVGPLNTGRTDPAALFPSAATAFSIADNSAAAHSGSGVTIDEVGSTNAPPALKSATALVVSHIDIPLRFRAHSTNAKAVARLVRASAKPGWLFSDIDGDPYLRAVLFETLSQPRVAQEARAIFDVLQSNEFLMVLRQENVTSPPPECRKGEQQSTAWSEGKIIVTRRLFIASSLCGGSGGITLPDEHWERAKRRDSQHLQDLTQSPAFMSPIRNRAPKAL